MYYKFLEMFFDERIHSKQNVRALNGRFRKKINLKSIEGSEERTIKKSPKDKKLIYAFFLNIA